MTTTVAGTSAWKPIPQPNSPTPDVAERTALIVVARPLARLLAPATVDPAWGRAQPLHGRATIRALETVWESAKERFLRRYRPAPRPMPTLPLDAGGTSCVAVLSFERAAS